MLQIQRALQPQGSGAAEYSGFSSCAASCIAGFCHVVRRNFCLVANRHAGFQLSPRNRRNCHFLMVFLRKDAGKFEKIRSGAHHGQQSHTRSPPTTPKFPSLSLPFPPTFLPQTHLAPGMCIIMCNPQRLPWQLRCSHRWHQSTQHHCTPSGRTLAPPLGAMLLCRPNTVANVP